jgi:hypothetical protein
MVMALLRKTATACARSLAPKNRAEAQPLVHVAQEPYTNFKAERNIDGPWDYSGGSSQEVGHVETSLFADAAWLATDANSNTSTHQFPTRKCQNKQYLFVKSHEVPDSHHSVVLAPISTHEFGANLCY